VSRAEDARPQDAIANRADLVNGAIGNAIDKFYGDRCGDVLLSKAASHGLDEVRRMSQAVDHAEHATDFPSSLRGGALHVPLKLGA
jgi:hypothetical protein